MTQYKDLISIQLNPFKKLGLDGEKLLMRFANFDPRKKTFSLKKEYLKYGSNLALWNSISFL